MSNSLINLVISLKPEAIECNNEENYKNIYSN